MENGDLILDFMNVSGLTEVWIRLRTLSRINENETLVIKGKTIVREHENEGLKSK